MFRKITIFLLAVVISPLFLHAQDACYNKYSAALADYKAGRYAEAQKKFISVANVCGDYSEVYEKLQDCNNQMVQAQKKLQEENTQLRTEIDNLKSKNKQLEKQKITADKEKKAAETKYSEEVRGHAQDKLSLEGKINKLDSVKNQLETDTATLMSIVSRLQDSLRQVRERLCELEIKTLTKDQEKKLKAQQIATKKCVSCIEKLTPTNFASNIDSAIDALKELKTSEINLSKAKVPFTEECSSKIEKFYDKIAELQLTVASDPTVSDYLKNLLNDSSLTPEKIQTFKEYQKSLNKADDK